jgi:hypothetical protein
VSDFVVGISGEPGGDVGRGGVAAVHHLDRGIRRLVVNISAWDELVAGGPAELAVMVETLAQSFEAKV